MGADGIFKLSLVLSGSRQEVCVSQVPDVFMPVTGARQMRCEYQREPVKLKNGTLVSNVFLFKPF